MIMGIKVHYDETGQFTDKQIKLAKEIALRIKQLRRSGCDVIAKQDCLQVYLTKEIQHSHLLNLGEGYSHSHPIPYLEAGCINDSGADDQEYFIDSYLMDE